MGWTREALGALSGISWSAIAQVESGRRTHVRPGTLSALSDALGVTIDYLVKGHPLHAPMMEHAVYLYNDDDRFKATMGAFLAEGVERGEAVAAVTTNGNLELLRERLGGDANNVELVDSADWLTTPPDALEQFRSFADARLRDGARWVRFLAEPIWAARSEQEVRAWTRFESLVNVLLGSWPITLVCPYDERSVAPEIVTQAHLTHPALFGDREVSESPDYSGPGRLALDP
jgi:transcriptional regulator with XRE-family HTH domain